MKLHEQKHYYGFSGLPNYWVDDKDNRYSDEFFDDKTYEDLYFDNFSDMDKMFGHENSLFGTRGLPVGHPDRTSKSFDQYNKTYGPMIVRVVNDTTLQEQISRIQEMMGELGEELIPSQPNDKLYHLSPYTNRELIKTNGLKPQIGDKTKNYTTHNPNKDLSNFVYALTTPNSLDYFLYGYDVWEIDLSKINNEWFKDPNHLDKTHYFVTTTPVPANALTLVQSDKDGDDRRFRYIETGDTGDKPEEEPVKTPEPPSQSELLLQKLNDLGIETMEIPSDLQEQTNRIKQMMGVINEDIPTSIRRRKHIIDALLKIIIDNSYPCDFADDESFLQGILYDLSYQVEVEGLPVGDLKDYIIEYFADDIQAYYINKTKDCDEI